jgi:hypothetical protein
MDVFLYSAMMHLFRSSALLVSILLSSFATLYALSKKWMNGP